MPAELSATAFISRSRPTTSGIIAWRAGIISAIVMPCTTEAANRCQSSIVCVRISAPITRAFSTETNCPAWSTILLRCAIGKETAEDAEDEHGQGGGKGDPAQRREPSP